MVSSKHMTSAIIQVQQLPASDESRIAQTAQSNDASDAQSALIAGTIKALKFIVMDPSNRAAPEPACP
jgi:hypothetical protein